MYRYTTPTLPLTITDVDFSQVDNFRIAFKPECEQHLLFIVDADDPIVDAETRTIYLELTQEQTASIEEGKARVQVRVVYKNGKVGATNKAEITIKDVYDKEIVTANSAQNEETK